MAIPSSNPDARRAVQFRLELETRDGAGNATVVELPSHRYFQSGQVQFTDSVGWVATLVLFDPSGGGLEDVLLASGRDRYLRFWWGFEEDTIDAQPIRYRGAIVKIQPAFSTEGTTLTLELTTAELADDALNKTTKAVEPGRIFSVEEGDKPGVVQEIAAEQKWKFSAETVQDVLSTFTEGRTSDGNETAVSFISRLAKEVVTDKDRNLEVFFDRAGLFHCHDRSYWKIESPHYVFARSGFGSVISFEPSDTSFFTMIKGSGNTTFTGFLSAAGERLEKLATQAGLDGALQVLLPDGKYVTDHGEGKHSRIYMTARNQAILEAKVKNLHAELANFTYTATMVVVGTHRLQKGGHVEVTYLKPDSTPHYLSGIFFITRVQQDFGVDTGWTTTVELSRQGRGVDANAVALNVTATETIETTPVAQEQVDRARADGGKKPRKSRYEKTVEEM